MKKVLHILGTTSRSSGGLYYSVSGLSRAISESGRYEIAVAACDDMYSEEDKKNWEGLKLISENLKNKYGFSFNLMIKILKYNPDIVHVHGVWNSSSLYARIMQLIGAKIFVSPRGMLDPWILKRNKFIKKVHGFFIEEPLIRGGVVHALCVSEKKSVDNFCRSSPEIFIAPNGIGNVKNLKPEDKEKILVFLGRLHQKKQTMELINNWKKIENKNGYKLIIAGWGESDYVKSIDECCFGSDDVFFVGSVYGREKENLLTKARYFILPSLSEGLPMAVLEAISHGCVPLITDECNLPELFEAGVAKKINKNFSDFDSVVAANLSCDEKIFYENSKNALKFSKKYLWDSIAEKVCDEYDKIFI